MAQAPETQPDDRKPVRGVRLAHGLLYATLALAPLPLASNHPWAWSALAFVVGGACVLWGAVALRHREAVLLPTRRALPFAVAFGAFLAWCALQTAPWIPQAWAPEAWREAETALGRDLSPSLALDPSGAWEAIMRLLSYAGVFWLSLHFARNSSNARRILWVLAATGFVYAAYGLAAHLSGSETILWFRKWHYPDSLTSTFVNRNSYATYAGLILLTVSALLIDRAGNRSFPMRLTPRDLLLALDNAGFGVWFLAMAFVSVGTALLLSQSRGGFAALLVGALAFVASLRATRQARERWWTAALALAVATSVLLAVSGSELAGRLGALMAGDQVERRAEIYALTARMIAERPWLGIGLGGFDELYHAERTDAFGATLSTFMRAHNSYLENALEAGIPAFLLLCAILAVLFWRCMHGAARRRHNAVFPCLGVAATGLVAAHSLVDFSLQIPAVSVTYAALLGVGVAQSWRHSRHAPRSSPAQGGAAFQAAFLPGGGEAAAQDRTPG